MNLRNIVGCGVIIALGYLMYASEPPMRPQAAASLVNEGNFEATAKKVPTLQERTALEIARQIHAREFFEDTFEALPDNLKDKIADAYADLYLANALYDPSIIQTIKVEYPVSHCAFNRDGSLLATGDNDVGTVQIWKRQENKTFVQVHEIEVAEGPIQQLAFSPDGRSFAVVCEDAPGVINVYTKDHTDAFEISQALIFEDDQEPGDNEGSVTSIAFSPDGKLFAAGSVFRIDAIIRAWAKNPDTHQFDDSVIIYERDDTSENRYSLTFTQDGRYLACVLNQSAIEIWKADEVFHSLVLFQTINIAFNSPLQDLMSVRFSPDGKFIVSIFDAGSLAIWSRQEDGFFNDTSPEIISNLTERIHHEVAIYPDSSAFISISPKNDTVEVWKKEMNSSVFKRVYRLSEKSGPRRLLAVAVSPVGDSYVTSAANSSITFFNAPEKPYAQIQRRLKYHLKKRSASAPAQDEHIVKKQKIETE